MNKLEIKAEKNGDMLTIYPYGRIDTGTAPGFEDNVTKQLDGVKRLTVDLSNVDYISSAGLRVVVTLHKTMALKGGIFTICGLNDSIRSIFTAVGLTDVLDIK